MRKTIFSKQGKLIQDAITSVREEAGLSQRGLCRILGKEHTFISKCELGERRVDIAEFYWICKSCGANPEEEIKKLIKEFVKLDK